MIAYPEGLPLPLLRSQKMSGRAVQRRLYRNVPTEASVSWLLSDEQTQLFEGWFDQDPDLGDHVV